jgi:hypothetical protein
VHDDLECISLRRALWKTQVFSSITMRFSNLASMVVIYVTPCSLVASQKCSDEVLPPSSGRRTARSRFLKHQTARRHLLHTAILIVTEMTRLGINKLKGVVSLCMAIIL